MVGEVKVGKIWHKIERNEDIFHEVFKQGNVEGSEC